MGHESTVWFFFAKKSNNVKQVTLVTIRQVQRDIEILLVSMISKPQTELSWLSSIGLSVRLWNLLEQSPSPKWCPGDTVIWVCWNCHQPGAREGGIERAFQLLLLFHFREGAKWLSIVLLQSIALRTDDNSLWGRAALVLCFLDDKRSDFRNIRSCCFCTTK